uniref:Dihydrolipoyllysine-residue succinyltransferase component of 2-oxoglutarate dehydrogenase complex, mitochondrial n=1 Tax=Romanomermis culicivorax TaxID=13658 RepID=A0A915KEB8_ROMCU
MLRYSSRICHLVPRSSASQSRVLANGVVNRLITCRSYGSKIIVPSSSIFSQFNTKSSNDRQLPQNARQFHLTNKAHQELVEVLGPAFAESITEGDIKWLKNQGDFIHADEIVAQIETDKTVVDVPAPQDGFITQIFSPDGSKVVAKQKLFALKPAAAGETPPPKPAAVAASPPSQPAAPPPRKEPTPPSPPPTPMAAPAPAEMRAQYQPPAMPPPRPAATPAAAPQTVMAPPHVSAEKAITGARAETRIKMNRMRQRIAQRLKDAQNTYAMLTTFNQIDMTNILALRSKYKDAFAKKHGVKFGLMSPFIKAAAYALLDQPVVNAVIDEGEIVYRHFIDMSVAVATERGLVVPVLRNVESMNYASIERTINELGEKARDNKLAIEDMEGGTFTISNGGVFGSLMGTPIINPPQSAILGMHATNEKPVAINGKIEIRPIMLVALTYDHRLIDGREAVTFLRRIKQAVEDPATMLLDL